MKSCTQCIYYNAMPNEDPCFFCMTSDENFPNFKAKPFTRGDLLRSFNDEQLAKWIDEFDAPWCFPAETQCQKTGRSCRKCITLWLEQPAEVM